MSWIVFTLMFPFIAVGYVIRFAWHGMKVGMKLCDMVIEVTK